MKKIKLFTLAFVIGTASIFATTNPNPTKTDIRTQIVNLLDTPSFLVDNTVDLNVSFTFNSEGEIVVLNVNSKNRKVLDYVRTNINGKKIENPGKQNKLYIVPLKIERS